MMWFGTDDGVYRYDGKKFLNFTTKDGLADNAVYAIYRDPDGVLWFGTSGGVSRYNGRKFITLPTGKDRDANAVNVIHHDPDGVMWFGAAGGLSRYDGKELITLTAKDGFVHNAVYDIHRDSDGLMWLATDSGVACYDGITWTSLDTRDGLAGNRVNAIHQAPDGCFWFGIDGGITRYRRNMTPPKANIVSITTDQTYSDLSAIPAFTSGTRITIKYSSIDFKTVPEKQQYRYRIREIDPDWHKSTKATSFDCVFDEPGTYTFEVQAIDRDLNYSEPAMIKLEVIADSRDQQIAELESELERRNRELEAELQDARNVQMSLMPETTPPMEGLEISGRCIPANTVSGDFFDYLQGKSLNEVSIVVADVMGKAMKGAMNAVMTDGILHAAAMEQGQFTPASLMMTLNNALKGRLEQYMNVTMVIGLIDAETKTLILANAGHHAYPVLLRNGEIQHLLARGMPLGMMAGIKYTEGKYQLRSGDVIIFMTDGIIEAQNSMEQQYSDSGRLEQTISEFTQDMSAEAMVEAVLNDAIDFGGDKTQRDDDMTIVVAKVL